MSGDLSDVFDKLDNATTGQRTKMVLECIENHPKGLLELPMRKGRRACLREVNLSPSVAQAYYSEWLTSHPNSSPPPWWDITTNRVNLRKANLEGADLQDAELEGVDLSDANLNGTLLQKARLINCNLQNAKLWEADLTCTNLRHANLQSARLFTAKLHCTILWDAKLQDADLGEAELECTNLTNSNLEGVKLGEAKFIRHIFIYGATLGNNGWWSNKLEWEKGDKGKIGEELKKQYQHAAQGYLVLKNYFGEVGEYNAARWAYLRERRMEKLATSSRGKFIFDQLAEWISDYGESIPRVFITMLVIWLLFSIIYAMLGGIGRNNIPSNDFLDALIFSLGKMTAVDVLELKPQSTLWYFVGEVESFLGIASIGLLGFILGSHLRRA